MTNSIDKVFFFSEDTTFELQNQESIKHWLFEIAGYEKQIILNLNYVFCSDSYLLELNKQFLNHNYFTDILTFPGELEGLDGDIFISIDRVVDNSKTLKTAFLEELHRVIAHGLLHLLGYKDKSKSEAQLMRSKEDWCLSLRKF